MSDPQPERYVLCLDDDPEFIKSLEAFLPERINGGKTGDVWYRFAFLQDPTEALIVLEELVDEGAIVAMIISDQQMPTMKGIEVLRRARTISASSLRILLTGHAGIEAAITAINDQLLDRYLTKPIEDEHDFTLNVQQLLQRFEMSRVIEAQASALQGLYRFANTINAMGDLQSMLGYVAHFTQTALECRQVWTVAAEQSGRLHSAVVGLEAAGEIAWDGEHQVSLEGPKVGVVGAREDTPPAVLAAARLSGMDLSRPAAYAHLAAGQMRLGVIVAGQRQSAFTEQDLETLGYVADTASIAIHKQLTRVQLEEAHLLTKAQAAVLDQANARLARLDEMKSEFLGFISHELRTPLSHMSAIGLLERPLSPDDWKEIGSIIQKGYKRLDRFIAAGLDYFSWCGEGRVETSEVTDLGRLESAPWIEQLVGPGVKVSWVTPDRPCEVRMSQATAETIVRILLENAIKFSGESPSVSVELTSSPGQVKLAVRDHGRGFPPEMAPELFRPFTVMDTLHHREGTGLNLARASAMVEAHGGRISAESAGPGQGATFTVELPSYQPSSAADADGSGDQGRGDAGNDRLAA